MANWYGTARSNYFRVKDLAAFEAWAEDRSLSVMTDNEDPTLVGIYPDDPGEDIIEIALIREVAAHLPEGQVVVLMCSGAEKLRYVTGEATAFDHTGKIVRVSINDIYALAEKAFGVKPTKAEY